MFRWLGMTATLVTRDQWLTWHQLSVLLMQLQSNILVTSNWCSKLLLQLAPEAEERHDQPSIHSSRPRRHQMPACTASSRPICLLQAWTILRNTGLEIAEIIPLFQNLHLPCQDRHQSQRWKNCWTRLLYRLIACKCRCHPSSLLGGIARLVVIVAISTTVSLLMGNSQILAMAYYFPRKFMWLCQKNSMLERVLMAVYFLILHWMKHVFPKGILCRIVRCLWMAVNSTVDMPVVTHWPNIGIWWKCWSWPCQLSDILLLSLS